MDNKDDISAEIKTSVEDKVKALKEVKDKDDNEAIKTKTQELSTEMQKIGEEIQKNAPKEPAQGGEAKPEEPIRDAEVNEDENKTN